MRVRLYRPRRSAWPHLLDRAGAALRGRRRSAAGSVLPVLAAVGAPRDRAVHPRLPRADSERQREARLRPRVRRAAAVERRSSRSCSRSRSARCSRSRSPPSTATRSTGSSSSAATADFRETMRFCLTGEVDGGRSATARSAEPAGRADEPAAPRSTCARSPALIAGWRRYVERTWGRPEMKARARVRRDRRASSRPASRSPFASCSSSASAPARAPRARLSRARAFDARALDPSPYLPRVRGRVDLVHGADDDVIPFEQVARARQALDRADARVHITGLYGHTGASKPGMTTMATELSTMVRMLFALS